jgi:hypothetical protein
MQPSSTFWDQWWLPIVLKKENILLPGLMTTTIQLQNVDDVIKLPGDTIFRTLSSKISIGANKLIWVILSVTNGLIVFHILGWKLISTWKMVNCLTQICYKYIMKACCKNWNEYNDDRTPKNIH